MSKIKKFFDLSPEDRHRLINAFLLVGVVRIALQLLPFELVRRWLANRSRVTINAKFGVTDRLLWAVQVASRHILGDKPCLTQALVAQMLLGQHGMVTDLHIGVAKNHLDELQAHAWLEYDGKVIIGDLRDLSRYKSLPPLQTPSQS